MTSEKDRAKTVKFLYTKSDDYKIIYANGLHGGITLQGEVTFDLFLEQRMSTKCEVHSIEEDGTLGERMKAEPEIEPSEAGQSIVIREKKIGIILTRDVAASIARWLNDKVKQIDRHSIQRETVLEEQDAEE